MPSSNGSMNWRTSSQHSHRLSLDAERHRRSIAIDRLLRGGSDVAPLALRCVPHLRGEVIHASALLKFAKCLADAAEDAGMREYGTARTRDALLRAAERCCGDALATRSINESLFPRVAL